VNARLRFLFSNFKAHRKTVIDGCRPLISPHFNLTVELPLKAIVRGYSWTTIPINWRNRRTGKLSWRLEKWVADISLSAYTYRWKNISARATTGTPAALITVLIERALGNTLLL
jgi:hypothetical protein